MRHYHKQISNRKVIFFILTILILLMTFFFANDQKSYETLYDKSSISIDQVPSYQGKPYVILNRNQPNFTTEDRKMTGEYYHKLDQLGRGGVAFARISIDTMPTEKRKSIGQIKPSGWHTIQYETVSGKYLYNRCHLIGYQLSGENANPNNLITCTRQMNTVGMLEFENKVAEHIKETGGAVLYRVTPIFQGSNLLASGVQIEAESVEDHGRSLKFNVFIYNVQDGIDIDYTNGDSHLSFATN